MSQGFDVIVVRRGRLAAIVAYALLAAPALGNETVNCVGLPGALSKATAGEVITLDELCTAGLSYHLPKVEVTLTGTPGAGFDHGENSLSTGKARQRSRT